MKRLTAVLLVLLLAACGGTAPDVMPIECYETQRGWVCPN